jgi:hypothetical protein
MGLSKTPLENVVRKSLSINVKDVDVKDSRTENHLRYLEDLEPNTLITIHLVPDLGRDMAFNLHLNVGRDRTTKDAGHHNSSFPKVAALEDVTKYDSQMFKCAQEITDGINKALKELE